MTSEEFDACKLPKRLSFRESEAARQVLVIGLSFDTAAGCCGINSPDERLNLKNVIEMITQAVASKN